MPVSDLLWSPVLRVYTHRLLLLALVVRSLPFVLPPSPKFASSGGAAYALLLALSIGAAPLAIVHHLSCVRLRLYAWLDVLLTVLEVSAFVFFLAEYEATGAAYAFLIVILLLLCVSLCFKLATASQTPGSIWSMKIALLGRCTPINPPYTPWRILLGRSLARPLVRGESGGIIVLRALVLVAITLGIPCLAVYYIVWLPINNSVVSYESARQWSIGKLAFVDVTPQFALISSDFSSSWSLAVPTFLNITHVYKAAALGDGASGPKPVCSSKEVYNASSVPGMVANCNNLSWIQLLSMQLTIQFPPTAVSTDVANVFPGAAGDVANLLMFSDPITVVPNVNLVASVSWTRRDLTPVRTSFFVAVFPRPKVVYSLHLEGIVQIPLPAAGLPANTSLLTIVQRVSFPTSYVKDYAISSPTEGLSVLGGFWTAIDGVFAWLFGASVLYFLLARRHLSALGALHIFQRGTLIRRWHEDFPQLLEEGGQPGSESAGVVAFIRERLLDVHEGNSGLPETGDSGSRVKRDEMETVQLVPLRDQP
ncbi:unnamed protein product [Mycena citricolor]|uniref:Transmembrane protein n=1 Tax=Mycena citricolor TaxID=2018698 RepID=A0AAD2H2N4_9AGAR|nr:unnamed protein product [Mycena citricolor]